MANFDQTLKKLLKQDARFVDENGSLIQSEVADKAWKIDRALVSLLLADGKVRKKFFSEIEKHWVFNAPLFVDFVQDKNFLNDSYTKFGQNIGLTIDGKPLKQRGEVALVWPFKDCVLEGGMSKEETQNQREVFFNEVLAQDEIDRLTDEKVLTNGRRFTKDGEQPVGKLKRDEFGTIRENLVIKGNNLLALHSLKRQFAGKIKLIYIDPPYNTGGDKDIFTYNNNFKHSTWLTFMKNRLEVAKDFLTEDGFIAIAIDHCELFYLGVLADEVFGRDNRLGIISVKHHPAGRTNDDFFATTNEYNVVYAKNKILTQMGNFGMTDKIESTFNKSDEVSSYKVENLMRKGKTRNAQREKRPKQFYPIYVSPCLNHVRLDKEAGDIEVLPIEGGVEWIWSFSPSYLLQNIREGNIFAGRNGNGVQIFYKRRSDDYKGKKPTTTWDDKRYNAYTHGNKVLNSLIGETTFPFSKSLYTVLDTLKIMTEKTDIIMDFFAGSGTTGHATLALNAEDGGARNFVLIEQLDNHIEICKERHQKIIAAKPSADFSKSAPGEFVSFELKSYNEEFAARIQAAKTTAALEKIWQEMKDKSFLSWKVNLANEKPAFEEWRNSPLAQQKDGLMRLLNKNQLYVNFTEIEDKDFQCTDAEKALSKDFYKK